VYGGMSYMSRAWAHTGGAWTSPGGSSMTDEVHELLHERLASMAETARGNAFHLQHCRICLLRFDGTSWGPLH
jgi:hypothetical protein